MLFWTLKFKIGEIILGVISAMCPKIDYLGSLKKLVCLDI